ncbi:SirA-like protein [Ferrimonas balearica DSM 9799]|uniref:SirA-like protein n=1 Tax=Ferrimonas balearica (strain DSM 9799 / CCM 4581 / KCTC 23876 / PAT) TaxID=550540 RepID=E1SL97_FERBD|nr:sulfurtransferase TusA family protein [Ferrimonas balearica]ADN75475.1 SirA-like protein [Ferrimonas balearica DSM 9799]
MQAPLQILDLRQQRCPMAMVETKLAIRARAPGQVLRVLLSDPGSRRDVPRWLDKVGIPYQVLEDEAWLTLQLTDPHT